MPNPPTSRVYQGFDVPRSFKNVGGDTLMTLKNISSNAGRISTQWDRGANSAPMWFKWEAVMKAASNVTISNSWRLYAYVALTSPGMVDGGQSDAALTAETQLNNFRALGAVLASANTTGPFNGSGRVLLDGRYVTLGWWNASGQAMDNVDGTSYIIMTPEFDDIQAPA